VFDTKKHKSPSLDENNQLQLGAEKQAELDEIVSILEAAREPEWRDQIPTKIIPPGLDIN